jgi:AP-2 complex subunit alpha
MLEWAERIISLMDDPDIGVTLSVTSLVITLLQDHPDRYKASYIKAASRLKSIVIDNECPSDYLYYRVPCPWLQVKLLKLLQYYPPSGVFEISSHGFSLIHIDDTHVRDLIRQSLKKIMDSTLESSKNVQQNNAENAVLFEATNLVIHLDTEHDLMVQISTKLGKFIQARETNVRYLGLSAMTHLAARTETLGPIKKHQQIIISSLKDRDISVRRQGLDLLYSMCDATNAQIIVGELLKYLSSADYAIREEMVLKIAILTEKYATEVKWYVDISLRLIAMAGDHVSDEVWQRVIQIITNNEELQIYATQTLLQFVKQNHCHETLVKIGAYTLGEFGHLIADKPGCSPYEQFMALQSKMPNCSFGSRAIILSSFVKFVNLFPEIKQILLQVFNIYSHSLDSELQQRACEYLTLTTMPTDDLLQTVCDEMPPFPERASALLSRLHSKHATTSDKRTWIVGGKDANADPKEMLIVQQTGLRRSFTNAFAPPTAKSAANGANGVNGSNGTANGTKDLAGLEFNNDSDKLDDTTNFASAAHLSAGWEKGYNELLFKDQGVLYEDAQIQVGLRTEYRNELGCIILYFTNKFSSSIGSFTTTLHNRASKTLVTDIRGLPDTKIAPSGQTQQTIMFEAHNVFTDQPTIRISYLAGALQAITLQIPVALHKYMDPADLSADDFFKRWKQIGGDVRETQKVFGLAIKKNSINPSFTRKIVEGFRWGILDGVDPNPKNIVGATVLHTTTGGNFGCLMRLEPNYESNVRLGLLNI